ncbi:unnamed protein product [Lupinus luteus]|uniref:ERCC4 domain-containing protein n=1 Tax=Lupinus luteus TaxID=3873 RepID=A0AAV1WBA7_LUPLU
MMDPIILSDEEDDNPSTPHSKKRRTQPEPEKPNPTTVFLIDDDPTPQKNPSSATPSFVAETPMSPLLNSDVEIIKCTRPSSHSARVSPSNLKPLGISQMICLESDNENEARDSFLDLTGDSRWNSNSNSKELVDSGMYNANQNETNDFGFDLDGDSRWTSNSPERYFSFGHASFTEMSTDNPLDTTSSQMENMSMDQEEIVEKMEGSKVSPKKVKRATGKTKMTKEERALLMEEKKLQKEQEKLKKAALKAEAAELKKIEKEKQKWEKGKFAIKSIVAEIDAKVVESGSIGGHLLTRFAEKGIAYRITSNPVKGSIVWSMQVPEHISQVLTERIEVPYVLLVYEAEKFCNLVINDSLLDQLSSIRSHYPAYTICYLTNRLMSYINKREQEKYKNPEDNSCWRRPPVEEALAKLTTHFNKVHSRQCIDEAELAEHVVGLTSSLASCQFRKKLTRLSVNANATVMSKDCVDRDLIKKSLWLKALVSIPKVQPRFALAIWKNYPTMKSLLSVYMDPSKSEHEKEFLLKDLRTEGLLGGDRRLGEVCSKRVYRILMSQSGCIRTDDVEDGADFFGRHS